MSYQNNGTVRCDGCGVVFDYDAADFKVRINANVGVLGYSLLLTFCRGCSVKNGAMVLPTIDEIVRRAQERGA
jgi:hypothetical protein